MYEWVDVADRLRVVQAAERDFAIRSLVEQSVIGPMLLDRLAMDLQDGFEPARPVMLHKRGRLDDESW